MSYGLTEMASQATATRPGDLPSRIGSAGRVLPHREIKISTDGEICVRGETRFLGYIEGDRLSSPFEADGWFKTGDLGSIDGDGYLAVLSRRDNLFISGGENIQPEEIERVLCGGGDVLEAVVVPVPHERYGFRPAAFVRMAPGRTLDEKALSGSLRELLPGFKVPDHFYTWPESGDLESLKTDRRHLQQLALGQKKHR